MARINADARVPGPPKDEPPEDVKKEKQLNVEMKETKFVLIWKEGNTVVNTIEVEKKAVPVGSEGDIRYPDLAKKIVRLVKDSKIKVQASIQGDAVRVTGTKRDDLQSVIAMLRKDVPDTPLDFNNFRD